MTRAKNGPHLRRKHNKVLKLTQGQKGLFWVVSAERAAADIYRAIRRKRQDVYVPARWRLVMLVVRNIPSFIFRKLTF